jgi:hypothetical protein
MQLQVYDCPTIKVYNAFIDLFPPLQDAENA